MTAEKATKIEAGLWLAMIFCLFFILCCCSELLHIYALTMDICCVCCFSGILRITKLWREGKEKEETSEIF